MCNSRRNVCHSCLTFVGVRTDTMSAITDRRVAAVVGALVADAAGIASYFKVKPKRNF